MTSTHTPTYPPPGVDAMDVDSAALARALYSDGITAMKGAFSREFAERMREDIETAFTEARGRQNGAVGRGRNRYYVEIHPEQLRGFVELVEHPFVRSAAEAVLGLDYEIVEVGFDVPFAGAKNQPWHRDFPMPEETRIEHRLTSLAFNLTAVDTAEDMGPFEIAPGTQWDDSPEFGHGMFPPRTHYPRYEALAVRKYPKMGDISVRSALTIHRGTENFSDHSRPVLVLGVDAKGPSKVVEHSLSVTKGFWNELPQSVRDHLACPIIDELTPVTQKHTIEGLVMGDAEE
jgi:ectoine hydroxylase-related dioxygenase (phytanoyl-CoA dioxygenase family)